MLQYRRSEREIRSGRDLEIGLRPGDQRGGAARPLHRLRLIGRRPPLAAGASERGASEFVIPAQTSVEIVAFTTTDEYCR